MSVTVNDSGGSGLSSVTLNGVEVPGLGGTYSKTFTYSHSASYAGGSEMKYFNWYASDGDGNTTTASAEVQINHAAIIYTPSFTSPTWNQGSNFTYTGTRRSTSVSVTLSDAQNHVGKSATLSVIGNSSLNSSLSLYSITIPSGASGSYTLTWYITFGSEHLPSYGSSHLSLIHI